MSNHYYRRSNYSIGAQSIGSIIVIDEKKFIKIVQNNPDLLVITTWGETFSSEYRYLLSYKGFLFFTTSSSQLCLPRTVEIMEVEELAIPKVNKWWQLWKFSPWDY